MGVWSNWTGSYEDSSISEGYGKCPMHVITNQSRMKSGMRLLSAYPAVMEAWGDDNDSTE